MAARIRFFYQLSIGLLVISLFVHATTFLPYKAPVPKVVLFALYGGIFITFFAAIRAVAPMVRDVAHEHLWRVVLGPLSRAHRIALGLLLVYVFFNFFFSLLCLNEGLSPAAVGNTYELHSHGRTVRLISEEAYRMHSRYELRGMTGHPILFQALALSMLLARLRWNATNGRSV